MPVTYAGVDWLTMTTDKDKVGVSWYDMYVKYRAKMLLELEKEQPFNNGYYAGLGIAHMRWGYSENIGYILIISGSDAERMWQRLQPVNYRVTRLDLCVDFVLENPSAEAGTAYQKLIFQESTGNRRYSLFVNNAGGATCYIGSRHSQQFGRLYDKGIQAKTHKCGLRWRAEVEYKKPLSGMIAKALAEEKTEERGGVIIDTVASWFSERGVPLKNVATDNRQLVASVEARITTAEKKMAWLRSQVRPTVVQLVEAGYGKKVLECLMLDADRLEEIEHSEI
jgi:DNA relaxase NicK